MIAAITDLIDLPAVQNGILFLLLGVLGFLGRQARNFVLHAIADFRKEIMAMAEKTTSRRDEQIEGMTQGIQEVKDEVVAVGLQVEQLNGKVQINTGRIDVLEAPRPRRKRGEPA